MFKFTSVGVSMAGVVEGRRLAEEFGGVVSLLRFLRRCGRLGEIDKFASAPDADSAIEVLRSAMSVLYRSKRGKYCHEERIDAEDVEYYKYLCGDKCVEEVGGEYWLRVECPRLPGEEELENLRRAINSGEVKPSVLAALALAKRRGRRGGA